MALQMSAFAFTVLLSFRVAYSLKITVGLQPNIAENLDYPRNEDGFFPQLFAAGDRRGLRGKGIPDCTREETKIADQKQVIEMLTEDYRLVREMWETSQNEARLPQNLQPQDEHYKDLVDIGLLQDKYSARAWDLEIHIAREKQYFDMSCDSKVGEIIIQREMITKFEQIIHDTMVMTRSIQTKVIARQREVIRESEAILSDIKTKERELCIQPWLSVGEQTLGEMRNALRKNIIEALVNFEKDLDIPAPPLAEAKQLIDKQKEVIDKQKAVIEKMQDVLMVSYARLFDKMKKMPTWMTDVKAMQAAVKEIEATLRGKGILGPMATFKRWWPLSRTF